MQEENKKQKEIAEDLPISNSPKKIDYTIQTMDFDLKKKSPEVNSLEIKEDQDLENKNKKIEQEKEPVLKEEKPSQQFNPFLEEITPSENNSPEIPKPSVEKSGNEKNLPIKKELTKKTDLQTPLPPTPKPLEKTSGEKRFSGNYLLIFLLTISLVTIVSSVYYFYFKNSSVKKTASTEPSEEIIKTEQLKDTLSLENVKDVNFFEISEDNDLNNLVKENKDLLENSKSSYYKIKQKSENLTVSDFLSFLEIQLPEEVSEHLKDYQLTFYNQDGTLKMSLIFEVNEPDKVKEIMKNNEYRLPDLLKPLFVDEIFALQDETINFRDSEVLTGVRYYNFVEDFDNKSIDWGIIENKFLIITTSKESARVVIDDLKNLNQDPDAEESLEAEAENKIETETIPEEEALDFISEEDFSQQN